MASNMVEFVTLFPALLRNLLRGDKAQDTFEYLLIIGGVSVAIIAAIALAAPGLINPVIAGTCAAINTVMPDGVAVVCA